MKTYRIEPGIYAGISNEEYHNGPGVSKSGLDMVARCPSMYKYHYLDGNRTEPTKAMVFGSAAHKAVLEPDSFSDEFVFAPEINRRTKAGKIEYAEFEAENSGKTVLPKDDYDTIMRLSNAVISHPRAGKIFSSGSAELSSFSIDDDTGEMVKVRPDWQVDDIIVDLKTTIDASQESFSKSCFNFNYHVQAAMYMDVFKAASGTEINMFVFVAVEKKEPFSVGVYIADVEMVRLGRTIYRNNLDRYAECKAADHWPGYNDDSIVDISLPSWAFR